MVNRLGIFSAVILVLCGAAFLYGPVSGPETSQTGRLLAGAVLVSTRLRNHLPPRERLIALEKTTGRQIDGSEIKPSKSNLTGTSERKRALVAIATRMFRKRNTAG